METRPSYSASESPVDVIHALFAVAIAAAACVPGTLVNLAAGGGEKTSVTFGHPSGTLKVGASASETTQGWVVEKAVMGRSARILMEGWVRVPAETINHG